MSAVERLVVASVERGGRGKHWRRNLTEQAAAPHIHANEAKTMADTVSYT